jgi:hypothetical protein
VIETLRELLPASSAEANVAVRSEKPITESAVRNCAGMTRSASKRTMIVPPSG